MQRPVRSFRKDTDGSRSRGHCGGGALKRGPGKMPRPQDSRARAKRAGRSQGSATARVVHLTRNAVKTASSRAIWLVSASISECRASVRSATKAW